MTDEQGQEGPGDEGHHHAIEWKGPQEASYQDVPRFDRGGDDRLQRGDAIVLEGLHDGYGDDASEDDEEDRLHEVQGLIGLDETGGIILEPGGHRGGQKEDVEHDER